MTTTAGPPVTETSSPTVSPRSGKAPMSKGFRVAQPCAAADRIVDPHQQIPQLV